MKRLLGMLSGGLLYFCLATVLAEGIMLAYAARTWNIDRAKLIDMLAVAQGIDLVALRGKPAAAAPGEQAGEQVSLDQVLEARALKARNLELREQALRNDIDQLRVERGRLAEEKVAFQKTREGFEESLETLQKRNTGAGWDENRRTLLTAKPKQAKELLLQMLDKKEIDDVVALLTPMPDAKRAKIFAEFKTPDEIKKVDEILRLVRRGEPLSGVASRTQQQLGGGKPAAQGAGP